MTYEIMVVLEFDYTVQVDATSEEEALARVDEVIKSDSGNLEVRDGSVGFATLLDSYEDER